MAVRAESISAKVTIVDAEPQLFVAEDSARLIAAVKKIGKVE